MLYSEKFQVRWHDTDATREVRPSEVLAYMQETANHQFRRHAVSLDELRDTQGVGFILSRIAVDFLTPMHAYEEITVQTATCAGHGLTFPRRFEVLRDGTVTARAMSQWAMVRVADRTLLRAQEAPLCFGDEPEIVTQMPLRFRVPRELRFEAVGERRVAYSDLDYNMHMNNTHYPDMICDFLEEMTDGENGWRVAAMSLSYIKESHLGATLTVTRSERAEDGTVYIRTLNEAGETCLEAVVKLEK